MKTDVHFDNLNFAIAGFVAAAMDMDARIFSEKPASRNIYLPILALIQALLTAPLSIE
jgi:hypothetical protein